MNPRQMHRLGVVENYGPKPARTRREMARLVASVRKVLWRGRGGVTLWVDRNYRQAASQGASWASWGRLTDPYSGWYVAAGSRALVHLSGKGGPNVAPPTLAA